MVDAYLDVMLVPEEVTMLGIGSLGGQPPLGICIGSFPDARLTQMCQMACLSTCLLDNELLGYQASVLGIV